MYTEENEFDYNDYLNENENLNSNNNSFNKGIIIKAILVVLCIILVIFLVFKIKNNNTNKNNVNNTDNEVLVFNNNVEIIKKAAEEYYFTSKNIPEEIGEEKVINLTRLKTENLITEIRDYNGLACGMNTSYASIVRNKNDYLLKIYLLCSNLENTVEYYYDLEGNCLTCNGEVYISSDEDDNQDNIDDSTDNKEDGNNETILVCGEFGAWTTEYIEDPTLERESRVVVIGYKDNYTYSDWSEPTKEILTATDNKEVKTEEKEEVITKTSDWVSGLSSKPEAKEGRKIESYTKKKTYTTYKTTTEKYTKNLTMRDPEADSCTTTGIGKVTCTYTKIVKTPVTKTKNVTYYKYQDTTTETVKTTYYQSRDIIKSETSYTDYILENEMPEGYQKLSGSETTQYRYREACTK